jgi:crotonobetainyl-CoA:carnitine CoA-transferase CaiB-like acyl-CoA transferase
MSSNDRWRYGVQRHDGYNVSGRRSGTKREQELLNGGSLYDFYETKDGKFISFGALEAQFFAIFCRIIGRRGSYPDTV